MRRTKVYAISTESKQFLYQGPRLIKLGPNSGEEFREKYLIPWLESLSDDEKGIIDFKGTEAFSPSFLEEAFAGAIRKGYGAKIMKLQFINIDPRDWRDDIRRYITTELRGKQL